MSTSQAAQSQVQDVLKRLAKEEKTGKAPKEEEAAANSSSSAGTGGVPNSMVVSTMETEEVKHDMDEFKRMDGDESALSNAETEKIKSLFKGLTFLLSREVGLSFVSFFPFLSAVLSVL